MLDALKLGMPGYDICYVSIYEQLQRHTLQVELLYGVFALNDLALLFSNNWHACIVRKQNINSILKMCRHDNFLILH